MNNGSSDLAIANEERAKRILTEFGILRTRQQCPWCNNGGARVIRREKFRCRECGREWSLRKGTILEGTRISYQTFLNIVRLFSDNITANDAAGRLSLAYNTVSEIYSRLAVAITGNGMPVTGTVDEPDVSNGGSSVLHENPGNAGPSPGKGRSMVFGIRASGNTVAIEPVDSPISEVITALPIPSMQKGNILFIDAYGRKYQGFITYETDRHGEEVVRIRARDGFPWSPLAEFWTFTGAAWKRHRGVKRERIPEFVRELEFRYNHRNDDLLFVILETIANAKELPPDRKERRSTMRKKRS